MRSEKEYGQAMGVLQNGKRNKLAEKDITAAAKIVNAENNRKSIRRLMLLGYTEEEAKTLIYTAP